MRAFERHYEENVTLPVGADEIIPYEPPHHKAWETIGPQRLPVIDEYRLGLEISKRDKASDLRVFIDYDLPATAPLRWLGLLFGKFYARRCVHKIINDARNHFFPTTTRSQRRPSP